MSTLSSVTCSSIAHATYHFTRPSSKGELISNYEDLGNGHCQFSAYLYGDPMKIELFFRQKKYKKNIWTIHSQKSGASD